MVFGHCLGLVAGGSVFGLAIAAASIGGLRALFPDFPPQTALSLGSSVTIDALVGLAAGAVPARRALSVDPGATLRAE
jgi:hypothetical protein